MMYLAEFVGGAILVACTVRGIWAFAQDFLNRGQRKANNEGDDDGAKE